MISKFIKSLASMTILSCVILGLATPALASTAVVIECQDGNKNQLIPKITGMRVIDSADLAGLKLLFGSYNGYVIFIEEDRTYFGNVRREVTRDSATQITVEDFKWLESSPSSTDPHSVRLNSRFLRVEKSFCK